MSLGMSGSYTDSRTDQGDTQFFSTESGVDSVICTVEKESKYFLKFFTLDKSQNQNKTFAIPIKLVS